METLLQDLRHGARSLWHARLFSATSVLALALGIGSASAVFSVFWGVVLRPLPFPEPERIVRVFDVDAGGPRQPLSPGDALDYLAAQKSFTAFAAASGSRVNLTSARGPEQVRAVETTSGLLGVLGVRPALGRDLEPADEAEGARPVVLLGDGFWRRHFAADPQIVGAAVRMDGLPYTVIGVLPAGLSLPLFTATEVLVPVRWSAEDRRSHGSHRYAGLARLERGVSLEQGQQDLSRIAADIAARIPGSAGLSVALAPLHHELTQGIRPALAALLGAVLLVLLIACANVAAMLLARGAGRARELAIRSALGGSRRRLLRLMLTEAVLLALLGGAAGLLLASWAVDGLLALAPPGLPRLEEVRLDGTVAGFALLASLCTGLLAGAVPALQASRADLASLIKDGSRAATAGAARLRARSLLVVAEIALALVLVTGAGLLLRSLQRLAEVPLGLDSRSALTARISLPEAKYPTSKQAIGFTRELLRRASALPGVISAATINNLPVDPFAGRFHNSFHIEGQPPPPAGREPSAWIGFVSPGLFRTLGIPLLRGRDFDERDRSGGPGAIVVNEAFARRFFPGEEALGQQMVAHFSIDAGSARLRREIVGVVGDVRNAGPAEPAEPSMYVPQLQDGLEQLTVVLRTSVPPARLAGPLRAEVLAIDPDQPIASVQTLEEAVAGATAQQRFSLLVTSGFALVALLLAGLGVYGLVACSVAQRTQEFGIRLALGAAPLQVQAMVLGGGLRLAGLGVGAGLLLALGAARLLSAFLYGVGPADPLTFVAVAALLGGVALLACLLPALRAIRVDPATALRAE